MASASGAPERVHRRWRIQLVGGFLVTCGGRAVSIQPNLQRLVAYTALQDTWVPRTRLACALWPDVGEARGASNLRTCLWRLARRAPLVVAERSAVGIADDIEVDVRVLGAVADRVFDGDETGLDEIRGFHAELLPGWDDGWLTIERERLLHLEVHLLDKAASACLDRDRLGQAVDLAHRAIMLDPLRESSHRTLIRSYLAAGNRTAAVTHFRRLATLLNEELGLPPEERTHELVASLMRPAGRRRLAARST